MTLASARHSAGSTMLRMALMLPLLLPALAAQQSRPGDGLLRQKVDAALAAWAKGPKESTPELAEELVALGAGVSPYLCQLLVRKDEALPLAALAGAVGRLGGCGAVPAVAGLLGLPSVPVRVAAVEALDRLACPDCIPALVAAVGDEEEDVASRAQDALLSERTDAFRMVAVVRDRLRMAKDRFRLTRLLGRSPSDEAHEALLEMLDDDDVCVPALQALTLKPRPEVGPRVIGVLTRPTSPGIKREACMLLGRMKHKEAIPELIERLQDQEPIVAAGAHWALRQITGLVLKAEPDLWRQWWSRSRK